MKYRQKFAILAVFILTFSPATVVGRTSFSDCLAQVKNGTYGNGLDIGATNDKGQLIANVSDAAGMTYRLCVRACGGTEEAFNWVIFSQQFGAWLLPWLALISQLPFGANDKLDNLESVLLTVGSPVLAAYSLALTFLNGRWIAQRFAGYTYPNARKAVRIFSSLQQSPLKIEDNVLLASLVVLPDNDRWWSELEDWIDHTHTWSISAVTNIAWVIIAYVITLIDSFIGDISGYINANGLSVGTLWLWLLPIVIGWLQISPKCDSIRLRSAIQRANRLAHVATTEQENPAVVTGTQAVELTFTDDDTLHCDERCTTPIYNYARFLPWVEAVVNVSAVFKAASNKCGDSKRVDGSPWFGLPHIIHDSNRKGNATQVLRYCAHRDPQLEGYSCLGPKILSRIFVASVFALMLQWCTTGAAVLIVWFTPTRGLGCRSAAYLLYTVLATVVWMLLVTSSFLTHFYTTILHKNEWPAKATKHLSIIFRRLGKVIAACNTIWIFLACGFQFSNFFDRCYCNSSVFYLQDHAYYVVSFADSDVIHDAWIGGLFLAAGSAVIYVLFNYVHINPP